MIGASPSTLDASSLADDVLPVAEPPRRGRRIPSVWPVLAAVAGLVGASIAALALVRHQGIRINGDEPQYLVEAESIARDFTLNSNPGYVYIITHHIIYPFTEKPGPNVAGEIGQAVFEHHLYLPIHSVGLSVLLAVPVLGGANVAVLAFMLMLAALAVGVVHLVGLVAGATSPWRFALAGVFLAPTYVLATTQVYPDLMTGMIIAIIIFLVALFEVRKGCTTTQIVTGGVLLAVLPWLAQKNIPMTLLLVIVLVVAHRRTVMAVRELAWLAIPALASLLGVVVFNLWAFGHPLGIKNPIALSGIETWTRSSALLFDRRSGILIQLPVILLGLAAMWAWRRRIPLVVIATVLIAAAVIYGNGTEPGSQTGGSFAGRYAWPLVPLMLGFSALYLIDLWRVRRAAVPLVVGVGMVLSVIESVPVVLNEHLYYSQVPWDPISYRGWWGGLDPSPVLGYLPGAEIYNVPLWTPGGLSGIPTFLPGTIPWGNARDLWGLACVLLLAAAVLYWLVAVARRPALLRRRLLGALGAAGLVCLVLTLTSPVQLPAPVTFRASMLASQVGTRRGGAVVATGSGQNGDVVLGPFWEVLPGRYRATIDYDLRDGAPGAALGQVIGIRKPPRGAVAVLQSSPLPAAATSSSHSFVVTGEDEVAVRVQFLGTGTIVVKGISLAKLAPG
jgi:hypothetical protein